jgi:hypothetical protein
MKINVFLVESQYGSIRPSHTLDDGSVYVSEGDTQISDPVEVDFETFDEKEIALKKLVSLDNIIQRERAEFEKRMDELKETRQKLLAIECD